MSKQYIVTFHTHYEALCCKRTLEEKISEMTKDNEISQIDSKLIPVPRALSSSCGTALNIEIKDSARINIEFLFECEHDEIYIWDEKGKYHLQDKCQ